ncbi:MAG: enolase, partial [Chloroflexi bacterium]
MKIVAVNVEKFHYRSKIVRDSEGHGHPGAEQDAVQSLLTIKTDDDASGHYFGAIETGAIEHIVAPVLVG